MEGTLFMPSAGQPCAADAGLDAVSVSLNAPDADTYAEICPSRYGREAYAAVKAFILACAGRIPDVAASAVALPGLSEERCRRVAEALGARFRWRPYDRLGRIEGFDRYDTAAKASKAAITCGRRPRSRPCSPRRSGPWPPCTGDWTAPPTSRMKAMTSPPGRSGSAGTCASP